MRYSIYKPNSKNTGCACQFSQAEDGTIYISAILQHSWNESSKTGSFSENRDNPDKKVNLKFNENEAGAFISAIDNYTEASFFHTFKDDKTQISLKPWVKNQAKLDSGQDTVPVKAWGFSITRNSTDKFRLPVEPNEAQVIKTFMQLAIGNKLKANAAKKENTDSQ